MGFLKRIFGGGSRKQEPAAPSAPEPSEPQNASRGYEVPTEEERAKHAPPPMPAPPPRAPRFSFTPSTPLSSPDHPAYALAKEAEALADEKFQLALTDELPQATASEADVRKFVDLIDKAIEVSWPSTDLLYAKASAYHLISLTDEAKRYARNVVGINKNHLDATMLRDHPQSWQHLFRLPPWSESRTTLHPIMSADLQATRTIQVVRDCLAPGIAILYHKASYADRIKRWRWEMRWAKTPHGAFAVDYLVCDFGNDQIAKTEHFFPHIAADPPTVNCPFWILQRLAQLDSIFLIMADGDQIVRNERFPLPQELKRTLSEMRAELDQLGPAASADAVLGTSVQWFMSHSEFDVIKF